MAGCRLAHRVAAHDGPTPTAPRNQPGTGTSLHSAAAMAVMVGMVGVVLAGCGGAPVASPTPTPSVATPSTSSAGGAVAGFLAAAGAQDNSRVPGWLATSTDSAHLNELLRVYSDFGTTGRLFWDVAGVRVTGVTTVDASHADVALSGAVVWCLGTAPNDPAATCSRVTGASGRLHTYAAIEVDGRWKADIDINASSSLGHNPQAAPRTAGPPAPPSPT